MAKGFSILDMMSEMSREEAAAETEIIEKVSVFDLQPNDNNFYEISNMEQLKNSIFAMGGIQQNLLLALLPAGSRYKYRIISGHRRARACIELVQEGHGEFEHVPAVIRKDTDKDTEDMLLVMTNSTQRELTDWEKVMQHMRLKEIIPRLKKRQGTGGKTRALEADYLGVSETQVAIYNTIGTSLNAGLMELLKKEHIGISLAYEAAKLEPDMQEQLAVMAHDNGSIYEEDIKQLLGSRPMEGQLKISGEISETEKVSESDIFEKIPNEQDIVPAAVVKKVSESDTFEKTQNEPAHAPIAEKKEICYTINKDDVDEAIYFIFRLGNFLEDELRKLVEAYRQDPNHIAAENAFRGMLPYEDSAVKVFYQMGYQVEYIHTGEIVKIPVYYFWKGFGREFERELKGEAEPADIVEDMEDVSESDTSATEGPQECKLQVTGFRGGYTPAMVDHQIRKYEGYLDMARTEGGLDNLVCEYSCLLDALELLRDRIARENEYDENNS